MSSSIPQIYTVADAAVILRVSQRTVRRLIARRELAFHKCGGQVRISKKDLETYLSSTRNPAII